MLRLTNASAVNCFQVKNLKHSEQITIIIYAHLELTENEYGILLIIAAIIPTPKKPQVALVVYFCFVDEIVQRANKLFEKQLG